MTDEARAPFFSQFMSPSDLALLSANGGALVQQIGLDVVREVVFDVLTGKNLRSSTELLTRRRIATLNLALVNLFLQGQSKLDNFVSLLPYRAAEVLNQPKLSKAERWLAQWMIGLTDKAYQNVLRDNPESIAEYRDTYIQQQLKSVPLETFIRAANP